MKSGFNYLDLFSGIGGFALGAYWAGVKFNRHYFSEVDPYCIELYQKRFPDAIPLGDIRGIDGKALDKGEWIITGGFPCQDISIAGKGAGIRGERSGLWFEYWRLINDLRPRYAIMENVGMLIHRGLREVLGSLAEIGYDAEWQDIRAEDVGAPHRRERIWIVAYPNSEHGQRRTEPQLAAGSCRESRPQHSGVCAEVPDASLQLPHGSGEARGRRGELTDRSIELRKEGYTERQIADELGGEVADTSVQGLEGEEPAGRGFGKQGLFTECGWWSTECRICRMVDKLSERMDGNGLTNKPGCDNGLLSQGVLDGKAEKRRTKDTLPKLREGIGEENIQRSSRGLIGIQETEILQSGVYVKSDDTKASDTIGVPGESKKTIRLSLRDMWDGSELAVSSCEQGCIGQPPGKRANALCELPFKMALAAWKDISEEIKLVLLNLRRSCSEIRYVPETLSETEEIWRSFNDEEKDWIALRVSSGSPWCQEWPMTGRLTAKQDRRVDRLRGLGNAIVPQIAELLFRQVFAKNS